jgi:hypothetical protein
MADSWKPEDKAAESAFENPEEFDVPEGKGAVESSVGEMEIREPKLPNIPES